MNEEQLGMLFQDFQQVDSSSTRKYEGTGLGLSISLKFAELMGGNITVSSELNKGSIFTVTLDISKNERKRYKSQLKKVRMYINFEFNA